MNIPQQLKKEEYRFVPIKEGMKNPLMKNWQEDNNYKYHNGEFQQKIQNGCNYGVVCGYGNLCVIDADTEKIVKAVEKHLPVTFTVQTGGGGYHFYYECPDLEKPIRLKDEKAGNLGDVQYTGKQVVGPGSIHPNGNKYETKRKLGIKKVKASEIKFALREWLKDIGESEKSTKKESFDIQISDVLSFSGLEKRGDEYFGPHPIHGSSTGKNFWVNTNKNVWHCFRHDTGGGPLQWLAVKENIIDCSEATPGALKDNKKFRKVLNELEKLGLWSPSKTDDKSKLPYFTKDGKFIARALAKEITNEKHYKTHLKSEQIYVYQDGIYHDHGVQDIKSEAQKRLGSMSRRNYINETVEWIKNDNQTLPEKFGGPKHKIACENGVINLETGDLEDFDAELIMLSKIPAEYDPDADCPKIKQFISEVVNDDNVKLVQEMFGYCLYKNYPIARAFMLMGSGANGKSTLLNLLTKFLGDQNASSPSLQELLSNRFKKIELFGKLANVHADLPAAELESTGTFKMLTGGDKIMGEKKGKDPIEFYNHAKLIYSANEYPSTADRTDAFFRRWVVIKLPNQFEEGEEETDPNILEKITSEKEMSGLLNWALEGLERILEKGHFSRTDSRTKVEDEWIRRTDSLRAFIDECITVEQGHKITKRLFFKIYKAYCNKHEIYSMKKGPVTKALPSKEPRTEIYQPKIGDKQVRCWRDLDLNLEVADKDFVLNTLKRMLEDPDTQDNQAYVTLYDTIENYKSPQHTTISEKVAYPVYSFSKGVEKNKNQKNIEDLGDNPNCEVCESEMGIEKEAERKARMNGKEKWLCEKCLNAGGFGKHD